MCDKASEECEMNRLRRLAKYYRVKAHICRGWADAICCTEHEDQALVTFILVDAMFYECLSGQYEYVLDAIRYQRNTR